MKASNKRANALDRSAAIPLYHQIFLQLRDEILSGQRACGSPVATEKELGQTYAVSRITARRALAELAQNRFVARKRRVGTTVIYRPPAKPIEANMDQAVDSLLQLGRLTKVRVRALHEEAASPWVAEAMRLEAGRASHARRAYPLSERRAAGVRHQLRPRSPGHTCYPKRARAYSDPETDQERRLPPGQGDANRCGDTGRPSALPLARSRASLRNPANHSFRVRSQRKTAAAHDRALPPDRYQLRLDLQH